MNIDYKVLIVLSAFILADILTGVLQSLYNKSFESKVMRQGLYHKLSEYLAAGLGYGLDYALPIIGVNVNFVFSNAIIIYICIMEVGSIIENIGKIFPELGKKLKDFKDENIK